MAVPAVLYPVVVVGLTRSLECLFRKDKVAVLVSFVFESLPFRGIPDIWRAMIRNVEVDGVREGFGEWTHRDTRSHGFAAHPGPGTRGGIRI